MNDNALVALFAGMLETALAAENAASVNVIQAAQPTQQSREESGEGVYFQTLFTKRYGSPSVVRTYNSTTGVFDVTESQQVIATIQISVFYPVDVNDTSRLSANDLAEQLAMRLQSQTNIAAFHAAGVGIMRITDVRNPTFDNEQDQQEFVPNFDMQLSYIRTITSTVQRVVELTGEVHKVN